MLRHTAQIDYLWLFPLETGGSSKASGFSAFRGCAKSHVSVFVAARDRLLDLYHSLFSGGGNVLFDTEIILPRVNVTTCRHTYVKLSTRRPLILEFHAGKRLETVLSFLMIVRDEVRVLRYKDRGYVICEKNALHLRSYRVENEFEIISELVGQQNRVDVPGDVVASLVIKTQVQVTCSSCLRTFKITTAGSLIF